MSAVVERNELLWQIYKPNTLVHGDNYILDDPSNLSIIVAMHRPGHKHENSKNNLAVDGTCPMRF